MSQILKIMYVSFFLAIFAIPKVLEAQVPEPARNPALVPPSQTLRTPAAKGTTPGAVQRITAPQQVSDDYSEDICVFRDELDKETYRSFARDAEIANQAEPILKSIDAITGKATKANVPLSNQLAAADIANFNTFQEKLQYLQILKLVESRRERDLLVINRMVAFAEQSYRYGIEPSENHPDFRILSSLRLIKSVLEQKPLQIGSPPSNCNVDGAIFSLQRTAIAKIGKYNLTKVSQMADQFRKKYNMGSKIEREKLGQDDQQDWDDVARNIAVPAERARGFLLDLEAGRTLLRASEIIYTNDHEDAKASGGRLDTLGLSIKRRAESNEFDEATVTAIGLWRLLNETDVQK